MMKKNIKLSIITINYNNAPGLQRTIQSVLSQSCHDYEWIVIDGGSTDGSRKVISQHAENFAYWVSEPDKGIYNAMNKGISHATGHYIQFLNSGDYYYDDAVVADFVNSCPTADVIYGRAMIVDSTGKEIREWLLPKDELRLSFFWSNNLNHQASFFARRCFDKHLFNEKHRINSDQEMFMTLAYAGYDFKYYDRLVVKYDNYGISATSKVSEFSDTVNNVLAPALRTDYKELIQARDVDLSIMIRDIIKSHRIVRNMARLALYPIHFIAKHF